jgi:hypothetical protein
MAITSGSRGVIIRDILTSKGTVYKNTKIKVEEIRSLNSIRVSDVAGRIFWVEQKDILIK